MRIESRCQFDERVLPISCLHWLREQAAEILLSIKRDMLDAKRSSESHTYHELKERLTNNVSYIVFSSTCEISVLKTVLSSNSCKYLTNSSSGECTANWLQSELFSQFSLREIGCPRAGKFSFQCYCICSADTEVNSQNQGIVLVGRDL